ncbi:unconventional myosin-XVIIIa-like, partial [Brachionus plicatilis]
MMSFFKKDDKDRKKKHFDQDASSSSDQTLNEENAHNQILSSSSKSSIDSSHQTNIIPPKPKKGILKTMSKFGHVNLTPKLYHKSEVIKNPVAPAQQVPKSIESSINTFSKRNSFITNDSPPISSQIIPDLRPIASYIVPQNIPNDSVLEPYLNRSFLVPLRMIKTIKLKMSKKFTEKNNLESLSDTRNAPIIAKNMSLGFFPGDQLISVNYENVLGKSLKEVGKLFDDLSAEISPDEMVQVAVRTDPAYADLIMREFHKSMSLNNDKTRKNVFDQPGQIDHSDINQVWFVQPSGYLPAKIFAKVIHKNSNTSLESLGSSSAPEVVNFKIKFENGKIIEVSEDCLEKSNPVQFDYCNDLSKLRFINETSLIHCLRQRHVGLNSIYTLIGSYNMLALGAKNIDMNMIHIVKSLKQSNLPPHIYSQAQFVYKNMLANRHDYSIVLTGHSNSGKSQNSKLILDYLFKIAAASSSSNFTESKLNSMYILLNTFCCVKTDTNSPGSNRFANVTMLEFNHSGQLASLILQLINLDPVRVIYQPNNESNYEIFYSLLYGANPSIKTELGLSDLTSGNIFLNSDLYLTNQDLVYHSARFESTIDSFRCLNFSDGEIKTILSILGAILHLGKANATNAQYSSHKGQFLNINEAQRAANLIGISFNQLNDFIFGLTNPTGSKQSSPSPQECLQGFVLGLYQECINLLVNCVNRAFRQIYPNISNSLLVIDPPGFQSKSKTSSYSDLVINYLNERFQLMFFQLNFINPIERCAQEGLDIDLVEHIPDSSSALINWFDSAPTNSILTRTGSEQCGLLWLLEEQLNEPKDNFYKKLIDSDSKQNFISTNADNSGFVIHHQFGNFPVEYNLNEWMDLYNKEFSTHRNASICLQESKKETISNSICQIINSLTNSNLACLDNTASGSLKRQASVRKMLTLSKKKTFL